MLSFYVKFWTDRKTDRRTLVMKYALDLSMRGHNYCILSELANNLPVILTFDDTDLKSKGVIYICTTFRECKLKH